MKQNEYKDMVDKMVIPENMDKNLKSILITDNKEKKKMKNNKTIRKISAAVACAALIFGLSQTEFAHKSAAKIVDYFRYGFTFTKDDGEKENVKIKMDYLSLDKNAPLEDEHMDSINQAGDAIGIKLLNIRNENKLSGYVTYSPMVSKDKKLYGVTIANQLYNYGDLKNIGISEETGGISFDKGEKYKTPIGVQITVRTDENMTEKYKNDELGYVSENQNVDLDNKASDAEVYELSKLGVKAVLFTVKTDGPILWGIDDGELNCTHAVFVYKGVEYVYYGGITHDTMKTFLDTLE